MRSLALHFEVVDLSVHTRNARFPPIMKLGRSRGRKQIDQHCAEFTGRPCSAGLLHVLSLEWLPVDRDIAVVFLAVLVNQVARHRIDWLEVRRPRFALVSSDV